MNIGVRDGLTYWRVSEKRQLYKMEQGGDVVAKVKLILNNRFQSAAAMKVMEIEVSK